MKQLFVLTKVYGLIVEDVEVFYSFEDAQQAFFEWTEGVTFSEYLDRLEAGTHDHMVKWDQTKIFEVPYTGYIKSTFEGEN